MQDFMPLAFHRKGDRHSLLFSPTGNTQGCDKLGFCSWRLTANGWHLRGKHMTCMGCCIKC